MSITLRDIRNGEEKHVLTIMKNILQRYGLNVNPETTDKDLSDIGAYYIDNGGCFKVLADDGVVVGSYGLFPVSSRACELRKMYLLPEYQGRGLGRLMMNDALSVARDNAFETMVLETNSVLNRATELYRKYGFEEYEPEHVLSDRCDVAMRKIL